MQKYIIPVGSEEISEQVQKALFSAGFSWRYESIVSEKGQPFLFVNSADGAGHITYSDERCHITKKINDGAILISSQEVISDPFQLDGAKSPVKEMTVAELEAKLGHPVKVIEG
jgi:hypothetical protein